MDALQGSHSRKRPRVILSVAYPFAPVHRDAVGGAEQVLELLSEGIEAHGYRSLVLAQEGSRPTGELRPFDAVDAVLTPSLRALLQGRYRTHVENIIDRERVDLLHFHGVDFLSYLPRRDVPMVATLHLPPSWYPPSLFSTARERMHLVCVSKHQRRTCRGTLLPISVISNGVRIDRFSPTRKKGSFLLSAGRICPEKGYHLAADAARRARIPFLLVGEVFPYPEHEAYFHRELAPRLRRGCRFLGPAQGELKRKLLARAMAVIVPSLVDETSSLVAMEALASGTPVIATRRGALPEVVEHGQTGFIANTVEEMVSAAFRIGDIDPSACRRAALRRFDARSMVNSYLRLYERLLPARPADPRTFSSFRAR